MGKSITFDNLLFQLSNIKIQNKSLKKQAILLINYLKKENCLKNEEFYLRENLNFSIENYDKILSLIELIEKKKKEIKSEQNINLIKSLQKIKKIKKFFTPKKIKNKNFISSEDYKKKNNFSKKKDNYFFSQKDYLNSGNSKSEDLLSHPSIISCVNLKDKKNNLMIIKKKVKNKKIEVFRNITLPIEKIPEFIIHKIWINNLLTKNKIKLFQYESEKTVLEWIEKFYFFNEFFPEPNEILKYMENNFINKNGFNRNWINLFLERNYGFFKTLKKQNPEFD